MVPVVAGSSPVRHLCMLPFTDRAHRCRTAAPCRSLRVLALVLAGIYAIAALGGLLADVGSTRDTVLWVGFLGGGAALILVGPFFAGISPYVSAAAVSIGAAAGGLPLFWTIVVPLAAAVVIAMGFALARRPAPPA